MLDLSTENKALCFEDSTPKPLYVFLYYWQGDSTHENGGYWKYFTTIDEAIVLESMEIDEGVLEGNSFQLGSFVTHSVKVQWQNNGISYKDMIAVPVQQIGTQYIAYFDGIITKEEISENGQTVTAKISSLLSQKLDIDVLPTLKEQSGTRLPIIVYHTLNNLGIDIRTDWADRFANADYTIFLNDSTLPQKLALSEFLKQIGEFLGGHVIAQEKRVVDNLDDMTSYQPTGRLEIGFMRLSNVDTVAQSNIKPLPNGYKRLEYIQSNGAQYIDTNFIPNENPRIVMTAKITSDDNIDLFGSGDNITPTWRLNIAANQETGDANFYYRYYSTNRVVVPYNRPTLLYKKCIYDIGRSIVINSKNYYTFAENYDFSTFTKSIKIFGSNEGYEASMILYDCKIYNGDTLVRDFAPALNSNGIVGLYDFVENKFYTSETSSQFVAPNPIETYTLPYYINLFADKTNALSIDEIKVVTKTGTQLNYTISWADVVYNTYNIKDNIFFEALSTQNWKYCSNAVREVGSYLENQNLYYIDLQTVYPPFIEGADYLIVKSKNKNVLPSGYYPLESIEIGTNSMIETLIVPNSDNIEIELDYETLGGYCSIFAADGRFEGYDTLALYSNGNNLTCLAGYYGGSIQTSAFTIPFVPTNQKINLNIKFADGKYKYSGTFNGEGNSYVSKIYTKETLYLGSLNTSDRNCKLHRFAYSESGVKLCDLYPCIQESNGTIGVYDIVRNKFISVYGGSTLNYESADTVVPVLSATARGIHSMRADILCKATNSNKN